MMPTEAITAATGAAHAGVTRSHVIEPKPLLSPTVLTRSSRYVAIHVAAVAAPRLTTAAAKRTGSDLAIREKFGIRLSPGPVFGSVTR